MGEAYHPEEAKRAVAQAEYFLKDGFQGNRTISSAWHTVLAMGSAYPLLLSDSIAYAAALGNGDAKCALEAWLYQVIGKGMFRDFLTRISSQPQIISAYSSTSPVRDKQKASALAERLEALVREAPQAQVPQACQPGATLDHPLSVALPGLATHVPSPSVTDESLGADSNVHVGVDRSGGSSSQGQTQPMVPAAAGTHVSGQEDTHQPSSQGAPPRPHIDPENYETPSRDNPPLSQRETEEDALRRKQKAAAAHSSQDRPPSPGIETEEDALQRKQEAAAAHSSQDRPPSPRIETEEDALQRKQEAAAAQPQHRLWSALAQVAAAAQAARQSRSNSDPSTSTPSAAETQQQQGDGQHLTPATSTPAQQHPHAQPPASEPSPPDTDAPPALHQSPAPPAAAGTSYSSRLPSLAGSAWQGLSAVSAYVPSRWVKGGGESSKPCSLDQAQQGQDGYSGGVSQPSTTRTAATMGARDDAGGATQSQHLHPCTPSSAPLAPWSRPSTMPSASSRGDESRDRETRPVHARIHVIRGASATDNPALPLLLLLRLEVDESSGCNSSSGSDNGYGSQLHTRPSSSKHTVEGGCSLGLPAVRTRIWVLPEARQCEHAAAVHPSVSPDTPEGACSMRAAAPASAAACHAQPCNTASQASCPTAGSQGQGPTQLEAQQVCAAAQAHPALESHGCRQRPYPQQCAHAAAQEQPSPQPQLLQLSLEVVAESSGSTDAAETAAAAEEEAAARSRLYLHGQWLYGSAASAAAYAASAAAQAAASRLPASHWGQFASHYLSHYLGAHSAQTITPRTPPPPFPGAEAAGYPGQPSARAGPAGVPTKEGSPEAQIGTEGHRTGLAGLEGGDGGVPGTAAGAGRLLRGLPRWSVFGSREAGSGGEKQQQQQQQAVGGKAEGDGDEGEEEEEEGLGEMLEDLRQVLTQSQCNYPPLDLQNGAGYHGVQSSGYHATGVARQSDGSGTGVGAGDMQHAACSEYTAGNGALGEGSSFAGDAQPAASQQGSPQSRGNDEAAGAPAAESFRTPPSGPLCGRTSSNSSSSGGQEGTARQPLLPIQAVKVVGHSQRANSLGETYTLYEMEVVAESGEGGAHGSWKVARRFSEFVQLKRALQPILTSQLSPSSSGAPQPQGSGHCLPPCWDELSQGRSVLGQMRFSPKVLDSRQSLLQQCLHELIKQLRQPLLPNNTADTTASNTRTSLLHSQIEASRIVSHFLAPPSDVSPGVQLSIPPSNGSSSTSRHHQGSVPSCQQERHGGSSSHHLQPAAAQPQAQSNNSSSQGWGANPDSSCVPALPHLESLTIKLVTHVVPVLPEGQFLAQQAGVCAGCKAPLSTPAIAAAPRMSWSWGSLRAGSAGAGGARVCWYTGGLFCSVCHTNDVHLIPGRVLHKWDLQPRPVCCAAAEFLTEVSARPVLCVSAVNPDLLRRVAPLARAQHLRQEATRSLGSAVGAGGGRARRAEQIVQAAGPRGYLFSKHLADFWALNDLSELSKGALSGLLPWLEGIANDVSKL